MKLVKDFIIILLFLFLIFSNAGLSFAEGTAIEGGQDQISGPALTTGGGVLKKGKFLAENVSLSNSSSTTWVNAFSTTVTLTGSAPQCIELRYSGEFALNYNIFKPQMSLRAMIDGAPAQGQNGTNGLFPEASEYNFYTTTAHNWWQCNLASGGTSHTVEIQFKPSYNGDAALVRARSLIIEFKAGN